MSDAPERIWAARGLYTAHLDNRWPTPVEYVRADRIEALTAKNERLRRTIGAAGKLGRIIGFLGDDEERIAAFLEACGPDLVNRARAALAEIEGEKP